MALPDEYPLASISQPVSRNSACSRVWCTAVRNEMVKQESKHVCVEEMRQDVFGYEAPLPNCVDWSLSFHSLTLAVAVTLPMIYQHTYVCVGI